MAARAQSLVYAGPVCPRCGKPLDLPTLRDGEDICPNCSGFFEVRVFHPPQRVVHVASVDGTVEAATPCVNHTRNAAVANCQRCGVFICALCELEVGGERYCPACFDRLSQDGTLGTASLHLRDYTRLAIMVGLAGVVTSMILGIPLGIAAIYYAIKGFRDRSAERGSRVGLAFGFLLGLAATALGIYLFWSLFRPTRR